MTNQRTAKGIRLDVAGVGVSVSGKRLLSEIDFTVYPGELVGILGPSGAGKSTLLYAILGLRKPQSGRIQYNGLELYGNLDRLKYFIGYVPQDDVLHYALTVHKVLYYAALLRFPQTTPESFIIQRIDSVLKVLQLTDRRHTKVKKLSGGQRKRVNLGIELLTQPYMLFLDEPTSGLDPALEEKMTALFKHLAQTGRTVLVTTHVMESVSLLDLILILHQGLVVYYGPPQIAPDYFQVQTLPDVYTRLADHKPSEWQAAFRKSQHYNDYVALRHAQPHSKALQTWLATTPKLPGTPPAAPDSPVAPNNRDQEPQQPTAAKQTSVPSTEEILHNIELELERLKRQVKEKNHE